MQLQICFIENKRRYSKLNYLWFRNTRLFYSLCNKLLLSLHTFQNKSLFMVLFKMQSFQYMHMMQDKIMMFQLDLLLFFNYWFFKSIGEAIYYFEIFFNLHLPFSQIDEPCCLPLCFDVLDRKLCEIEGCKGNFKEMNKTSKIIKWS